MREAGCCLSTRSHAAIHVVASSTLDVVNVFTREFELASVLWLCQVFGPLAWPPSATSTTACEHGFGMAVSATSKHIIVSSQNWTLFVYTLNGVRVGSFGSKGSGSLQFDYTAGGLCMSSRDTILVAEAKNKRVQELRLNVTTAPVRMEHVGFFVAKALVAPEYVACAGDVIAVSEPSHRRITVLSYTTREVMRQFGSVESPGHPLLDTPKGLRLLPDGSSVVVADEGKHCVFVLDLSGAGRKLKGLPTGASPLDVVVCDRGERVVAVLSAQKQLVRMRVDGSGGVEVFGGGSGGAGSAGGAALTYPVAAALVHGSGSGPAPSACGLVVLDYNSYHGSNTRLCVYV